MSIVLFAVLIVGIAIGLPIAVALASAALIAVVACSNLAPMALVQRFFTACDSFPIMAIPFFMIAGLLMERGGVSKRLINLANVFLAKLSGGLAIVTIFASTFFGALSGSSPATVAAIGGLMIPSMIRNGYDEKFALATAASSGYLGVIIPPSIAMVTFGVATGASIGALFMAGIVPGVLICLAMSCYAYYVGRKNGYKFANEQKITWMDVWRAFVDAIWAMLMPVIILGGIYGGIFTPTEAACVALFYGLIVGLFIYKETTFRELPALFKKAAINSAMVMFIIAAATAFGYIMTREMIPMKIATAITMVTSSPAVFLLLVNIILLIMGTFMETNAAIMLTAPIFLPIVQSLGIDLVLFGIVMVINLAIGMITPPLGVNLFVAAGIHGGKIEKVVNKYLIGYLIISIIMLMIITYIPPISLTLPSILGK